MSRRAPLAVRLLLLAALGAGGVAPLAARAGDDPVAAAEALLAAGEGGRALAAFRELAERPGGGDDPRVQAGLGAALVQSGDPSAGLAPLWVAAKRRGSALDHLTLAEALVAVAEERIEAGPRRSVDVVPYLEDAAAEAAAAAKAAAGEARLAPRIAYAAGRARWLRGDAAGTRQALEDPSLAAAPAALDLLARACYALGDFAAAAVAWQKAGNAHGAAAAWGAGKDPRALPAYLELLAKAPADRALLEEAVGAAIFVGDAAGFDASLGGLAKAAATTTPAARFEIERARGLLLERAKRPADAAARFRAAREERPDDAATISALARAVLAAAPTDPAAQAEAVQLYLAAVAKDPGDRLAKDALSWIAARDWEAAPTDWPSRARLDRCAQIFQALADADPEDATAWAQYGNALRVTGNAKAAIPAYDRAVALNPFDASVANDRGLAVLATGDVDAAIAAFEAAVAIDRKDPSPRQNLGRLHWLRGEDDAAEAHLAAAVSAGRSSQGKPLLYRFLLDRVWRARVRPATR